MWYQSIIKIDKSKKWNKKQKVQDSIMGTTIIHLSISNNHSCILYTMVTNEFM